MAGWVGVGFLDIVVHFVLDGVPVSFRIEKFWSILHLGLILEFYLGKILNFQKKKKKLFVYDNVKLWYPFSALTPISNVIALNNINNTLQLGKLVPQVLNWNEDPFCIKKQICTIFPVWSKFSPNLPNRSEVDQNFKLSCSVWSSDWLNQFHLIQLKGEGSLSTHMVSSIMCFWSEFMLGMIVLYMDLGKDWSRSQRAHIYPNFVSFFHAKLVVESDSMKTISWMPSFASPSWRFQFYFIEIKSLSSSICVEFQHISGWLMALPIPWMKPSIGYCLNIIHARVTFAVGLIQALTKSCCPCLQMHHLHRFMV